MYRCLLVAGLLAGCAPASPLVVGPDHPAHVAAATDLPASTVSLALAEPPALPAVLRPSAHGPMDHAGMNHGAMADMAPMDAPVAMAPNAPAPAAADTPALRSALDAYLAVHDALAADRLDRDATRALADAIAVWIETPPPGDIHFWHMRMETTTGLRTAAVDLAAATALPDARAAFGRLSAPLADVLDATGVPPGYDLARHVCGMAADAPRGGVWLQATGDLRNPYFGTAMATCGTHEGAVGGEHEGADHSHDHSSTHDGAPDHGSMAHANSAADGGCCADGCSMGCCAGDEGATCAMGSAAAEGEARSCAMGSESTEGAACAMGCCLGSMSHMQSETGAMSPNGRGCAMCSGMAPEGEDAADAPDHHDHTP